MTIQEYIQQMDEIIEKMLRTLIRAQRKVDDKQYRDALSKLEKSHE